MLSCVIDSLEERKVMTLNPPGASMQANMDEFVHVIFEGVME